MLSRMGFFMMWPLFSESAPVETLHAGEQDKVVRYHAFTNFTRADHSGGGNGSGWIRNNYLTTTLPDGYTPEDLIPYPCAAAAAGARNDHRDDHLFQEEGSPRPERLPIVPARVESESLAADYHGAIVPARVESESLAADYHGASAEGWEVYYNDPNVYPTTNKPKHHPENGALYRTTGRAAKPDPNRQPDAVVENPDMFRRQLRSQLQMPEQHQKSLPKRPTPTEMKHQQKPTPKKEFLETVLEEDCAPATSASNPLVPASATREIEDRMDPDFPLLHNLQPEPGFTNAGVTALDRGESLPAAPVEQEAKPWKRTRRGGRAFRGANRKPRELPRRLEEHLHHEPVQEASGDATEDCDDERLFPCRGQFLTTRCSFLGLDLDGLDAPLSRAAAKRSCQEQRGNTFSQLVEPEQEREPEAQPPQGVPALGASTSLAQDQELGHWGNEPDKRKLYSTAGGPPSGPRQQARQNMNMSTSSRLVPHPPGPVDRKYQHDVFHAHQRHSASGQLPFDVQPLHSSYVSAGLVDELPRTAGAAVAGPASPVQRKIYVQTPAPQLTPNAAGFLFRKERATAKREGRQRPSLQQGRDLLASLSSAPASSAVPPPAPHPMVVSLVERARIARGPWSPPSRELVAIREEERKKTGKFYGPPHL